MRKLDSTQTCSIVDYIVAKKHTLAEISAAYGVSPSRISQIKKEYVIHGAIATKKEKYVTDDMGNPIEVLITGTTPTPGWKATVTPRGGFGMAALKKAGISIEYDAVTKRRV